MTEVITRFAPSPTGTLHVGSARTALFNYLFTRKHSGTFLLRFEDTDRERSKKEYADELQAGLAWLGIEHDGTVLKQSERGSIYAEYLTKLLDIGAIYEAEDSEKGSGNVLRFKNPNKEITFTDLIRGEIMFDTTELGDFVVARDPVTPLYHLSVVVDDIESGITHVIRGDDHISNTPRQILILEALGYPRPRYAHIPLILAPDKSKLSKRHGAVSVNQYNRIGVLPDALVNYLALLGWHPQDDRELFSRDELIEHFELSRVQKSGAVFDMEKLRSMNKKYVQQLTDEQFLAHTKKHLPRGFLESFEGSERVLRALIPTLRERVEIFSDITRLAEGGELGYFFKVPTYDLEKLPWKDSTQEAARRHLAHIADTLAATEEQEFIQKHIKEVLWDYATEHGRGAVLWPVRYALSGKERSPDPFVLAEVLGKEETLHRINHAITLLS